MDILKLKNGSEEAEPLVVATMMALRRMMESGIDTSAVYELVQKCRNPAYVLFGNAGDKLEKAQLMEKSGQIHDSIRNIVLSDAVGEGGEMHLESPIAR